MASNMRRNLRDWQQQTNKALRNVPGLNNMPFYPASYFGPLSNLFGNMDKLFEQTLRNFRMPAGFTGTGMFLPKVDIASDKEEYTITAELPGLEEKDVRLHISGDGTLTISGEKRQEMSEDQKNAESVECSYGAFERSLTLPNDIDLEGIEAQFRNGVLTITCPRQEGQESSFRQIPIASNENSRGNAERNRGNDREKGHERGHAQTAKRAA